MTSDERPAVETAATPDTPRDLPAAGAISLYSDLTCPFAHIAAFRLQQARVEHGLDGTVIVDHRALPLEPHRSAPQTDDHHASAIAACRDLEPDAGWGSDPCLPLISTIPGHEAVQAAKAQGSEMSVALDRSLRIAYFRDSADLSDSAVVLEIAASIPDLDLDSLETEIRSGRARSDVARHLEGAHDAGIDTSPTFVSSDGSVHVNPGLTTSATSDDARVVVTETDRDAIVDLVLTTASGQAAE